MKEGEMEERIAKAIWTDRFPNIRWGDPAPRFLYEETRRWARLAAVEASLPDSSEAP